MIYVSIALAIAAGLAIYFWRRSMTLQESLDSFAAYNEQNTKDLQAAVAAIPEKIEAAKRQAVADYIKANPPSTGPVTIDGVTYESLVAFIQTLNDASKRMIANTQLIPALLDDAATPAGA